MDYPTPIFPCKIWQLPCISVWLGSIDAVANKTRKQNIWEVGKTRHFFFKKQTEFYYHYTVVPLFTIIFNLFSFRHTKTADISSPNLLSTQFFICNEILFLWLIFYFYQQWMRNSQVLIVIVLSAQISSIFSMTFCELGMF